MNFFVSFQRHGAKDRDCLLISIWWGGGSLKLISLFYNGHFNPLVMKGRNFPPPFPLGPCLSGEIFRGNEWRRNTCELINVKCQTKKQPWLFYSSVPRQRMDGGMRWMGHGDGCGAEQQRTLNGPANRWTGTEWFKCDSIVIDYNALLSSGYSSPAVSRVRTFWHPESLLRSQGHQGNTNLN